MEQFLNKNNLKTRRIAWKIIKKASYQNRRLSDITAHFFKHEKESLEQQEKRFITMIVQGTVRMSGRLDWEIKKVFLGEYGSLKENFRILLRIGAYQLRYMDITTIINLLLKLRTVTN